MVGSPYVIDKMDRRDWKGVCAIIAEGIATGHTTFNASTPDWECWNAEHLTQCRLIARADEAILGWAALVSVSGRCVYSEFWTLQAGIFPENSASLALHRRHGFREVGTRERFGKMTFGELEGTWRDVVLLERRSDRAGID